MQSTLRRDSSGVLAAAVLLLAVLLCPLTSSVKKRPLIPSKWVRTFWNTSAGVKWAEGQSDEREGTATRLDCTRLKGPFQWVQRPRRKPASVREARFSQTWCVADPDATLERLFQADKSTQGPHMWQTLNYEPGKDKRHCSADVLLRSDTVPFGNPR